MAAPPTVLVLLKRWITLFTIRYNNRSHKTSQNSNCLNDTQSKYKRRAIRIFIKLYLTCTFSRAETDSSEEFIAQHGLSVPHSQLQTHPPQLLQRQLLKHKCVIIVGVQVLLHDWSLPLSVFRLSWEQISAEPQTQS